MLTNIVMSTELIVQQLKVRGTLFAQSILHINQYNFYLDLTSDVQPTLTHTTYYGVLLVILFDDVFRRTSTPSGWLRVISCQRARQLLAAHMTWRSVDQIYVYIYIYIYIYSNVQLK